MNKEVKVGIADMKILRNEGILITYALGSCIGISLYDPVIRLASLLHIMLPAAIGYSTGTQVYKFADTGIQDTLRKMAIFGGDKSRYECRIAGGAKMFEMQGNSSLANIGQRNTDSVKGILLREGIRVKGQQVGGNYARTMLVDVQTGKVKIRTFGRPEITL